MEAPTNYIETTGSRTVESVYRILGFSVALGATVAALYAISRTNYLLYHSLAELFSIVIASGVFVIAWNARDYGEAAPYVFLGIAYLAVAVLDTFHTLTYPGMTIFSPDRFYANQIWIATRFIESSSLVLFFAFPPKLGTLRYGHVLAIYAFLVFAVLGSVVVWEVFPAAFVAGRGQTPFKIIGEYVVVGILAVAGYLLWLNRDRFDAVVWKLLGASIAATMFAELFFTLYQDNYGVTNFVGHLLKIASYAFVYKAIIESRLRRPYETIFRDLRQNEESLRQANATKDRFFSIIAHDLKNPIHGIAELSRLAVEQADRSSREELFDHLNLIRESADTAVSLLDKLLIWARSQTGRLRVEPYDFDLSPLVLECKRLTAVTADEKGIAVSNEVSPQTMVHADPNMVTTVLRNLLANGVKFSEPNGVVRVTAEVADGLIIVSVRDTGVGMTPEELETLFRIDATRTKRGTAGETGTGLGLIICKEFVERNNGRVWATSKPGSGSTFYFTLPAIAETG